MSLHDPTTSLDALASKQGLSIIIIGAHALAELGVVRQTFDLDLIIPDSDKHALSKLLCAEGYASVAETDNFQRFSHPDSVRLDIDVLFVDPSTFEKLTADSSRLGESVALRIPSLPHFIALKLHAVRNNPKREARDLGDVAELLRAKPGSVTGDELEEICRAHGPEGVYSKLKDLT